MTDACVLTHGLRSVMKAAARPRRRPIMPFHPLSRPHAKTLRAKMAHVVYAFFVREAPRIIAQVMVLRGKMFKAALTQDERDALERLLAEIDLTGWAVLAGDVDDIIEQMAEDGALGAFAQLGINTTADPEVLNIVRREALDYAAKRSAELVGMRRTSGGDFVPNPSAEWQITEPTRDMLRADIRDSLEQGWSNDILASKLSQNYAFSDKRAMTIARTETIRASNAGAVASYAAAGVEEKEWSTAEDDAVSEDCEANGEQGPIPLNESFDSGDDAPPAHPNCRCAIVPVVYFASEQPTSTEEDAS